MSFYFTAHYYLYFTDGVWENWPNSAIRIGRSNIRARVYLVPKPISFAKWPLDWATSCQLKEGTGMVNM